MTMPREVKERLECYAEKYGYDVVKAINDYHWLEPHTPWYGGWEGIVSFINEREENKEYFVECIDACGEDCESPFEFWHSLAYCFESMIISGNPWLEEEEEEEGE